jgi:Cu(I)/Ag(I) efflux system periplasmic protein CusF
MAAALSVLVFAAGLVLAANGPTHNGLGVIKGLDAAKGTIVLAHEPIPALKWPAMTMPFRIVPEMLKGLKVGQRVEFEFQAKDMNGTIIRIRAIP